MKPRHIIALAVTAAMLPLTAHGDGGHRAIGKYPGNPAEDYAPTLVADNAYRNVALNRVARTSSQYDFNLTPQLLTDGIAATSRPPMLTVATNSGTLGKREREWAIDGNEFTNNTLIGPKAWISYRWTGMRVRATKVRVVCTVAYDAAAAGKGYAITLSTLQGNTLRTCGRKAGTGLPGTLSEQMASSDPNKQTSAGTLPQRVVEADLALPAGSYDNLRLALDMPGAAYWAITELKFFDGGTPVTDLQPSREFGSAWMSDGGGRQWAMVDLGRPAQIDRVSLKWIEKAVAGHVEVATDTAHWHTVAKLPGGRALTDDLRFATTTARYVRVVMTRPTATGRYVMGELEVMGRGGLKAVPHAPGGMKDGRWLLNGGNWRLARTSQVGATGEKVSAPGFDDSRWLAATVPATVLTSYVNAGALPDQAEADNVYCASESFFNSDFWYRTTFSVPGTMRRKHVFLDLDGINWKADVWLNGKKLTRVEGAFRRSHTDITGLLAPDGDNVLAIRIVKNAHPGSVKQKNSRNTDFNGGILGLDNPTFHSTIGWDWITTVRGRDTGIWNDVALSAGGDVTLADPLVSTELALPDTLASLTPRVVATNNSRQAVSGTLRGWVGGIRFEKRVSLEAGATEEVAFTPADFPQLSRQRLRLWWPNGYGEPYLHKAGFEFVADGEVSSRVDFNAGIRQMTYADTDTRLRIYVNGRRFVPLGGNWGFSEQNLNFRGREYDIAVRYHRDMNFNMIRNWVGQTGDEEFYDACDRYGIMVWQDFWLANPCDGPDPADEHMFLDNARDYTLRMRRHPSIGIYCGRNEGYPPQTIDKALRQYVATLNPGLGYISSSADDGVSGHGPYWACTPKEYFERQTGKLHSERGMPNVMTIEGLSRMLTPGTLWPQGDAWGEHDYCMEGAQRGATFNAIVSKAFGKPGSAAEFASLAQWENYDGYRAMYESGSKDRMGLLIWMSHSCWPSLTWCCYDYYFEPTAAFFGAKKACEPLHIQWNELTDNVEVVNTCAGNRAQLTAERVVSDAAGHTVASDVAVIAAREDTTVTIPSLQVVPYYMPKDGGPCIVTLRLTDTDGRLLSQNRYVRAGADSTLTALRSLPRLDARQLAVSATGSGTRRTVTLANNSSAPAMMIRLNLTADDGGQILPVDYSDNYFHLLPGERAVISVGWDEADARGRKPVLKVGGLNAEVQSIAF